MSYTITKSDGSLLTTIADYKTDTTTSLSLPGRGVVNYGQMISENFVYLLENFSGPTPPVDPLIGQFWFHTSDNSNPNNPVSLLLPKVYTGDTSQGSPAGWKQIGGTDASVTPPSNPHVGELWYNLSNYTLYVWNGSSWVAISVTSGENPPTGVGGGNPQDGTQWLMMPEHMLWVFDSSLSNPEPAFTRSGGSNDGKSLSGGWRLVGPMAPHGSGIYSAYARVKDTGGGSHNVIVDYINGYPICVTSPDSFDLDTSSLTNFTTYGSGNHIAVGMNVNNGLKYTNGTVVNGMFNGTSQNSNLFSGLDTSKFIGRGDTSLPTGPASDNATSFGGQGNRWSSIYGTTIYPGGSSPGNADTSNVNVMGKCQAASVADIWANTIQVILSGDTNGSGSSNGSGNFNVTTSLSDAIKNRLNQMEQDIQNALNAANNANSAANGALTQSAADNRYIQFTGTGDHGVSGTLGSSTSNCFSTIFANTFQGTATTAKFSDLAENYKADAEYLPGTLMKIGGVNEITQTTDQFDCEFFGVISTQPGLLMNSEKSEDKEYYPIALSGRVPVRVEGIVKKGDRLVSSSIPGIAMSIGSMSDVLKAEKEANTSFQQFIIGRALEDKNTTDIGLVESFVQAR